MVGQSAITRKRDKEDDKKYQKLRPDAILRYRLLERTEDD